jgi:ATPase subunit of ABC transporter with duplicated ATPase domains
MYTIKLNKISYRYENNIEDTFKDISFDICSTDKIALIGANGKGKTTILKILNGELKNYTGSISYPKHKIKTAFLHQQEENTACSVYEYLQNPKIALVENKLKKAELLLGESSSEALLLEYGRLQEEYMALGAYDYENKRLKMLKQYGFEPSVYNRFFNSLSGGEKTRLQLIRVLLEEPDFLIMDEPSNHLDYEMLENLENYLKNLNIPLIFVSHDRTFIDNVANKVIVLERNSCNILKTNYSEYKKIQDEKFNLEMERYQNRQEKIKQLQDAASARRKWASSFQRETGKEGRSFKFEMISNPAKQMMRQAKSIENRIKTLEKTDPVSKPWIEKKRNITFNTESRVSQTVITLKDICLSYDQKMIFKDFNLLLEKSERIHLKGKNGSGKTCLMKIIQKSLIPDSGSVLYGSNLKIGYFDQELNNLDNNLSIIDFLSEFNPDQTYLRTVMGCLKIERDNVYKKIADLSYGEKVKVSLCSLLISKNNLLLLDEPTNHLDIDSRIALEEALSDYKGTLIFVSHDRTFINKLADYEICLDI